jgi:hypothetical protein
LVEGDMVSVNWTLTEGSFPAGAPAASRPRGLLRLFFLNGRFELPSISILWGHRYWGMAVARTDTSLMAGTGVCFGEPAGTKERPA